MSIELSHISKSFGSYQALRDVSLTIHDGELVALLGPAAPARRRCCGSSPASTRPKRDTRSRIRFHDEDVAHRPAAAAARRLRVPALRAVPPHERVRERGVRPARACRARLRPANDEIDRRVTSCLSWCSSTASAGGSRRSSPAASGNGSRWPGRWPSSRKVLLLDEPFGALDAKVRQGLRAWLRRLHDEIHVTSILVTHDQEEALEVADRVVVMNHGRIEQVGTPEEVFHQPATQFVMEFLGQVNVFHGRVQGGKAMLGEVPLDGHFFPGKDEGAAMVYMRPHELDIKLYRNGAPSFPATVTRINPAGSIAKVTTRTDEGQEVLVDLSLDDYQRLSLTEGSERVHLSEEARVFLPEYEI